MRIALIGTRGVPARYGGFETAVEEVGRRLAAAGHEVVVYCRRSAGEAGRLPSSYRGMRLVHLPAVPKKALETLSHTALSVLHVLGECARGRRPDAVIVFNSANSPLLPVLRAARIPVATHVDGLEWRRAKWSGLGKRYYRVAESLAVRWSDELISDAHGIEEYYREEFRAPSRQIAYGAPQLSDVGTDRLVPLGLGRHGFHLVVARFEPENHVRMALQGYTRSGATRPLIVVGSAPYGEAYTAEIRQIAARDPRIRLLGAVWDQLLLDQLYANCLTYLHGHSVGGTNPSLLRAMGAGAAAVAYDVGFNHEVLGSAGRYFGDPASLAQLLDDAEADVAGTVQRGRATAVRARRYDWDAVTDAYAALATALAGDGPRARRRRPSGHRTGRWDVGRTVAPTGPAEQWPRGHGPARVTASVSAAAFRGVEVPVAPAPLAGPSTRPAAGPVPADQPVHPTSDGRRTEVSRPAPGARQPSDVIPADDVDAAAAGVDAPIGIGRVPVG